MKRFWLCAAVVLSAGLSTACDLLLVEPASDTMALELAYPQAAMVAAGGVVDVFNKADRAWIRLTVAPNGPQLDTIVRLSRTESNARIRLAISAKQGRGLVRIETEIRLGPQALFAGATEARLEVGKPESVSVTLFPVVAGLVLPDSVRTLRAVGDSAFLRAALVFATGDTIPGLAPSWSSENPTIVGITSERWAIARQAGQTRVLAEHQSLRRVQTVRVLIGGGP